MLLVFHGRRNWALAFVSIVQTLRTQIGRHAKVLQGDPTGRIPRTKFARSSKLGRQFSLMQTRTNGGWHFLMRQHGVTTRIVENQKPNFGRQQTVLS